MARKRALEKASQMYHNEEIVLDDGDFIGQKNHLSTQRTKTFLKKLNRFINDEFGCHNLERNFVSEGQLFFFEFNSGLNK